MHKVFQYFLILFLFVCYINAQENDSLKMSLENVLSDSTKADSTKNKNSFDDIVNSKASDSLFFHFKTKKMSLYGNSSLKHKATGLESATIYVDFDSKSLEAYGIPDTAKNAPEGKHMNTPILKEGSENYEGKWIRYNFETKAGFISEAKNKEADQRYEGKKVKKIDEHNYFIEDGMFTTCESDTPHTYFKASKMKIVDQESIIAEWIWMYIVDIPMPVPLPFGVFPAKSERSSGLIMGAIGYNYSRGHTFERFGYYWAMNDYVGARFTFDFTTRGGYNLASNFDYSKKYSFSGNLRLAYTRSKSSDVGLQDGNQWQISLSHNQTLDPTSSISANLNFSSNDYYKSTSTNPISALQTDISSNASYSKRWDNSSISASYTRSQKLLDGTYNEELPNVTFTKNTFYPFRSDKKSSSNYKWYDLVSVSYNANLRNSRAKTLTNLDEKAGISGSATINASPKLGYFSITPSINYSERWMNKRIVKEEKLVNEKISGRDTSVYREIYYFSNQINSFRDFRLSISAATKLYGTLKLNTLGIEAIRHTLNPSVSFSFTPDFYKDKSKYTDFYVTHKSDTVKYSIFENNILSGPSSNSSGTLSFSMSNIWEMKLAKSPEDTTNQQEKIKLLSLNLSTSYDLNSKTLGGLNTSFNTTIGKNFNLYGSSNFTFYDTDKDGRPTRDLLIKNKKGLLRMTNFSLNFGTSFSGNASAETEKVQKKQTNTNNQNINESVLDNISADFSIPWDLRLDVNYNWAKYSRDDLTLNVSGNLSLTSKWKIEFGTGYSKSENKLTTPRISIYRDLHCWEMSLSWNIGKGYLGGYYFIIRMKAPQFKDIKYEKNKGISTGLR